MIAGQQSLIKSGNLDGPKKKVAVIGCGVGGLVSIKTALDYGHDVTGFERLSDIGGFWNWELVGTEKGYSEIKDPDTPCYPAYKSLYTNTCKYTTAFSDFPPLDCHKNEFLTHFEVTQYAKAYAQQFQLLPRIKFNAHVLKLNKEGQQWHVTYNTGSDVTTAVFDYVMVTTGAFAYPRGAGIEGKEKFKGLMIHSGQVRNEVMFKDKRVLVIGGSFSGGEMMNLALRGGVKKLYISPTRRPATQSAWTIDRYVKSVHGDVRPWDSVLTRECTSLGSGDLGSMLSQWCFALHKAKPDSTLVHPGDALGITCVDVVQKGQRDGVLEYVDTIKRIDEHAVILNSGRTLPSVDVIVCAIGYEQKFPFLDERWPRGEQSECKLYNYVVSPNPALDGIGFALMQPSGFALLPVAEMQARWFMHQIASRPYNSDGTIYTTEERHHMNTTVAEKQATLPPNARFNYILDVPFLNEYLAIDIGAQPPDYKALIATGDKANIELGVALAYGPYTGLQYRIQGPHAWPQAAPQCIAMAKCVLGTHFDDYVQKAKKNIYPRSGDLDPSKGPYNEYEYL